MKTADLMLVFWKDRDLLTNQNAQKFCNDMRSRAVAGYSRPSSAAYDGSYEHMAAVVPFPHEAKACADAKEIK